MPAPCSAAMAPASGPYRREKSSLSPVGSAAVDVTAGCDGAVSDGGAGIAAAGLGGSAGAVTGASIVVAAGAGGAGARSGLGITAGTTAGVAIVVATGA